MRLLKYHERKLLKKVDFLNWKKEDNVREVKILRRYLIQDRMDYVAYNKLCGRITKLVAQLAKLPPTDPFRQTVTTQLIDKLYNMGIIPQRKSLAAVEKLSASAFCRRRLPVVMVRLKMAENLREAVTFIEQGHVRVGPETVTDPAFIVTRVLEDYVTWTANSKIRQKIQSYHNLVDDYDLL